MRNTMKLYCPHVRAYTHIIRTDVSAKRIQNIANYVLNTEDYNYDTLLDTLDSAGIKYELITLNECTHIDF